MFSRRILNYEIVKDLTGCILSFFLVVLLNSEKEKEVKQIRKVTTYNSPKGPMLS